MFTNFFERRRERRDQERWNDGFDWAAGALLRREETPASLSRHVDFLQHPFDRGARAAIDLIVRIGDIEDDRHEAQGQPAVP